jgi:hypothetical protein
MGEVYAAFESMSIPDYVARKVVSRLEQVGIEFVDHRQDAPTTRGSRIPSTVPRLPISAYNLGFQEGRQSLEREARNKKARGYEPGEDETPEEPELAHSARFLFGRDDVESDDVPTQAEEPIEDRLHRAWLNGYREGSERAHRGIRWDHS